MSRWDGGPIVVTMGDPAGIGPDILIDVHSRRHELQLPTIVAIEAAVHLADRLAARRSSAKVIPQVLR